MKHKSILSVVLVLNVALLLMTFGSTTRAQPRERLFADTGVITLGPNQVRRITVAPDIGDNAGNVIVRFGRTAYTQQPCNLDGVCKLTGANTWTGPVTVMPGEAASCDILTVGTYGRGLVMTNSRRAQVTASIINTGTGNVDAVLIGLLLP